jgi:hypothetical protein
MYERSMYIVVVIVESGQWTVESGQWTVDSEFENRVGVVDGGYWNAVITVHRPPTTVH